MSTAIRNLILILFVSLLLVPQIALADARIEARRHFYRALSLIQEGKVQEGIEEFKNAYEILPRPAVLYNIARAYQDINDEEQALDYYRRYLASSAAGDLSEVRSMVSTLERRVQERQERAQEEALVRQEAMEDEMLMFSMAPQFGAEAYAETVVAAGRFAHTPLDAPSSTTIVTAQDIRLSGLTSLPEILRRAAGVEVMDLTGSDHQISIRGLNQRQSNKVLVLINGRSVYLDFSGNTFYSILPVAIEDVERIEVIRGPASAVHGADAFTGIINIVTKAPGTSDSGFAFGAGNDNAARAFMTISGDVDDPIDWTVSGGYEKQDHYSHSTNLDRIDIYPTIRDTDSTNSRIWLRGDFSLSPLEGWDTSLGTSMYTGHHTYLAIGRLRETKAENTFFAQSYASVETPYGLALNVFWNHLTTDTDPFVLAPESVYVSGKGIYAPVVDAETVYMRSFNFLFDHDLALGLGYRGKHIEWTWLDDDHTEHHYSVFAENTMRPLNWMQLALGGRVDRHPLLDAPRFSPRASLVMQPADGHAIRVFAASAFRSPSFLESYLYFRNGTPVRGVSGLGRGNTDLRPEGIVSMELGYVNQSTQWLEFEANIYHNLVVDQIMYSRIIPYTLQEFPGYDYDVDAFPIGELQFINEDATYRQIGMDGGARFYPMRGLDAYANYSIHNTSPVGDADLQGRELDQRTSLHKINVGASYRQQGGLELSLDLHWSSPQVWVEQIVDPAVGVRMQDFPLDGFTLINARIGQKFLHESLELSLAAHNILGIEHRQHPFAQTIGRRFFGTATYRF